VADTKLRLMNPNLSGNEQFGIRATVSSNSGRALFGALFDTYVTGTNPPSVVHGVYSLVRHMSGTQTAYGIYSDAEGGSNTPERYSGYFTGGKVVMTDYVGIGIDPTYVSGTVLYVNGNAWASGLFNSSDERLKTEIKPLSGEKDKLYLLQGKSYKKTLQASGLKGDTLPKKREKIELSEYGYLAQEVKEIFPNLVVQDSAGYYGLNYIGLIPVIIEVLKDQRLENEKQQIQIEEQREQIKQLIKLMNIKSINEKVFEENGIESIPLLLQNTPNPFNQTTEIGYYIPETVKGANIYIYDMSGFQQRNISISERGKGATISQASALQAGIYFYTLICDGKPVDTKQMILTK
jgi:hypothetical protein